MKIELEPGMYIVAVSGGVDSVVLLDMLVHQNSPGLVRLVVAHFDHGIRADSLSDREWVRQLAEHYDLPFTYESGRLGPGASEDEARRARYAALERACLHFDGRAIITAHHQDDVLETAFLNLIRGTGRKGLSSLTTTVSLIRPLLDTPKQTILEYAKQYSLTWREDSTNVEDKYLRNYIRRRVLPRLDTKSKAQFLEIISKMRRLNAELDNELMDLLKSQPLRVLDRRWLKDLPYAVTRELLAAWLRLQGMSDFNTKTLDRLAVASKTKRPGSRVDIFAGNYLIIQEQKLVLMRAGDNDQSLLP